jgi:tetratricopeptide (TPR) repeat protein
MSDLIDTRQIRIFISSTFLDMMTERDYLVMKVFPSLRRYCEERDITLVELDLRWGITEEESKQGRVIETCLHEIKNSKPFFIGLLGERYGWIPDEKDVEVIDKNTSVLSDYPWVKDELKSGTSITEIEIQEGVLRAKEEEEEINAYFYFRSPLMEVPQVSMEKQESPEASQKLAKLKNIIREQKQYPVEEYSSIENLGQLVEKDFKELAARLFPDRWSSELEKERREQRVYFKKLTLVHEPRLGLEETIDNFVHGKERALVITGKSGSGKSALLANWIKKKEKDGRPKILYHFIGASGSEGDYRKIRQRLTSEIQKIYGFITDLNLLNAPANDKELSVDEKQKNKLQEYLFLIPKDENLVIVLDGLDKLTGKDDVKLLNWLPAFPENVQFIFSTPKDDPVMDVFKRLKYSVMAIPALDIESRKRLITDYFLLFGKKLTPLQRDRIANDEESANPLVLRALLDELRAFGVFEKLDEEIDKYLAAQDIPEFYTKVLERLEKIFDYADTETSNLAADILALLFVSRNGLSETEIKSLTGAKPVYWSQVYNALGSNLTVHSGLVNFSHNYIREAIRRRYFSGKESEDSYRLWLIHYYKTTPDILKKRIYKELPYQLYNLGDMGGLYRFLMNLDVMAYWVKKDIFEFGKYWRALREADKEKYSIEKYLVLFNELNAKKRDKTDLAGLYDILSDLILFLGDDNASALKFSQQALAIREEILGEKHADTAGSYNSIGLLYFVIGNYPKALEYYQQALTIQEKTPGDNHPDIATAYNYIGMVYAKMGNNPKALEYYLQALTIQEELFGKKNADVATSYNNIGQIYFSMGNNPKALEYYQQALTIQEELFWEKNAFTFLSYNNIGQIYTSMGNNPKALEYYLQALNIQEKAHKKKHPDTATIYNNIGLIYNSMGDYSRALMYIQQALAIQEELSGEKNAFTSLSYNNIGLIYHSMGNNPKAIEYYLQALDVQEKAHKEKHLDTALVCGNLAEVYRIQGDYPQALEWYHKALSIYETLGKEYPEAVIICNSLAKIHTEQGIACFNNNEYDRAITEYTEAIRLNPADASAYNLRGNAYYSKKDYEQAVADYSQAIKLNPNEAVYYGNRGNSYHLKGDYDLAITDLTEAIRLKPNYTTAYNLRGNAYHSKKDYEQAVADYSQAIKLNPNEAVYYGNRGGSYRLKGDYDLAIIDLTEAIRLNPNYITAYYWRGYAHNIKKDYDQAIADFTNAINLDPKYMLAYNGRGNAYDNKGNYDYAIADYTQAINLASNDAGLYNSRGCVYYRKGNYDMARIDFEQALRLNPNYTAAQNNIKHLDDMNTN